MSNDDRADRGGGLARAPWERVGSREIHETPFLTLREDKVRIPDGRVIDYGVVDCGECVGVLPLLPDGRVVMVGQYRYIAGRFTWEMPTGGVHEGEGVEAAAQRELAEEAGYVAGRLTHLCTYHTSKSSLDETAHLYLGEALSEATATPDDTEWTETTIMTFDAVLAMVLGGEIRDGMTIIAVLATARLRDAGALHGGREGN
jgi:ADP-ribose pyrophosphatase